MCAWLMHPWFGAAHVTGRRWRASGSQDSVFCPGRCVSQLASTDLIACTQPGSAGFGPAVVRAGLGWHRACMHVCWRLEVVLSGALQGSWVTGQ
jgi:hypothetical protein